jgi:superoxide oxidase
MTMYSSAGSRDRRRIDDGRRRFDIVTIGLHWATVTLIAGMFASAWLLLASDREHAAMLLTVHRSLGVATWAVAIVRLGWRFSYAYLPPFPPNMSKVQQRLAKASEYGLYALLLLQPLTGLAQSLARGRPFMLFAWRVPNVMTGDKPLTALFHQLHALSAWVLLGLIGLHILAALFHRFVLRDEVLQSMLPWRACISRSGGRAEIPLAARDVAAVEVFCAARSRTTGGRHVKRPTSADAPAGRLDRYGAGRIDA